MSTAAQPVPTETSTSPLAPLVLIADDQPHILDALEFLLEPEGYRIEKATSPYMVIDALKSGTFDALLLDLNYTRDTTSGREGLDLLTQIRSPRVAAPRHRHDRVGQRRAGRRSHAPRRHATSSRSPGTTRGCSPSCAPRSSCATPSDARSASKPRIASCAPRVCRR